MTHVLEIVRFRTTAATPEQDFIASAASIEGWLRAQPGFVARRLGRCADGMWIDCVEWRDMEAAQAAAKTIMAEPSAAAMMAAIDGDDVEMRHAVIKLAQ